MKTAKKAGLKSKSSTSKQKYILPTPPMTRRENGRANGASIDEELAGTFSSLFAVTLKLLPPLKSLGSHL